MTPTATRSLAAPFRGLAPFDESELDALLFFGRERETEVTVANLLASRLTILYGPSGVGKSSLLRAGVVRRIRELAGKRAIGRGPDGAIVVVSAWADDPVAAVAGAIADEVRGLVKRSGAGPAEGSSLADVIAHWSTVLDGDIYLVLDQLEEHFVYHAAQGPGTLVGELPEVVLRPRLRANVLLSLRDDALAQLDVFKASIPSLFANSLRLDRLDRAAATAAILGPLQRWNDIVPDADRVEIEPALVDAVLAQVVAAGEPGRVEAPYLQLVMERLWNEELGQGSSVLRVATLAELGGASAIVREHLDRALGGLDAPGQEAAARMFQHLVTPSGTKVAHRVSDLAEFARTPVATVAPVLASLGRDRILRPLDDGSDRYEIFHDVLADAVLGWRRRREVEQERIVARRRQRRLAAITAAALALAAVMVGIALYALSARSDARHQQSLANASRASLATALRRQRALTARANREATRARQETAKADRATKHARDLAILAQHATTVARQKEADAQASAAARLVAENTARKDELAAEAASADARRQRDRANELRQQAEAAKADALRHEQETVRQAKIAVASGQAFDALTLLSVDPQKSLELAVEAAKVDRSPLVERALRSGLFASHELHSVTLPAPARAMATAPGRAVIATTAKTATVVDLVSSRILATLSAPAPLRSVAITSDGMTIATGDAGGNVVMWSAAGARLRTLAVNGAVNALAFSADGTTLAASGQDRYVTLWDAASGGVEHSVLAGEVVQSIVFGPGGDRFLAFGRVRTIQAFATATGVPLYTLTQNGGALAAAFSPDGSTIVSGGRDTDAYEWSAASGALVRRLTHAGNVDAISFASDDSLVGTASTDGTARLWDPKTGDLREVLTGHTAPVVGIGFSPDSQYVLTASADRTARIWSAGDGFQRELLAGHTATVVAAQFIAGRSRVVTAAGDRTVRFWDAQFEPPMNTIGSHSGRAVGVAFVSATTAVSAGADGTARLWDVPHRRLLRTFIAGVPLTDVAASESTIAASATDGRIFLWRPNGATVGTISGPAPARSVAVSRDGNDVVVAGGDKTVRVYHVAGGAIVASFVHPAAVNDAVFSPDGSLVATAGADDVARIWRVAGQTLVRTLAAHDDQVLGVAFSHDGKLLVTASRDHDLRIWSVASGATIRVLRGHAALVSGAAFSADDGWVVSAGPTKVGVWAVTGDDFRDDRLYFLGSTKGQQTSVAFAPIGHLLLSAGVDGVVRSYNCTLCGGLDQLLALAEARLGALG
jgi:WD40 repeat protein